MSCVYKHTFPNGSVYIGKTDMKPEERWLNGWGYKNCPLMFEAILKYGWNNVKSEILIDGIDHKTAVYIEAQEIAKHALSHELVYNSQGIPAQYYAQESAHFIEEPGTKHSPHKPSTTMMTTKVTPHHKHHVVPLVEKPSGIKSCPIDVYSKDGKFICTYPTAKIASEELGVNHGDIISCCKGVKSDGQPRYQVRGYVFRYHID